MTKFVLNALCSASKSVPITSDLLELCSSWHCFVSVQLAQHTNLYPYSFPRHSSRFIRINLHTLGRGRSFPRHVRGLAAVPHEAGASEPAHGRVSPGVGLGAARAAWVAVVVGVLRLADGNGEPARGVVCEAAQAAEPRMHRSPAVSRYVNVPVVNISVRSLAAVNMPLDRDASGHAPSPLRVASHRTPIYIWKFC